VWPIHEEDDSLNEFLHGLRGRNSMTFIRLNLSLVLFSLLLLGPSLRAQDIDLVGATSWDRFGQRIRIEAERVDNNLTSGASGFLRLQIWATDEPYDGVSDINGYVIGTFNLGSLAAGSSFVNLSRFVRFFRPPAGIYYTTITLEEETVDGFQIVDSANFDQPAETLGAVNFGGFGEGSVDITVPNPNDYVGFFGDVSWLAGNGRVQIFAEQILNERAGGRSGVLRIRLWATSTAYDGGAALQGFPMATKRVGRVDAGFFIQNFSRTTFFRPPLTGNYYVTMTLEELVRGRWEIVDFFTWEDGLGPGGTRIF
jgi:hypothetical protein